MGIAVILAIIAGIVMIAWITTAYAEITEIKANIGRIETNERAAMRERSRIATKKAMEKRRNALAISNAQDIGLEFIGMDFATGESMTSYGKYFELCGAFDWSGSEQPERCDNMFLDPEQWGMPSLQPGKVYYLCHPCTTGGGTITENKAKEEELYKRLLKRNPWAKVIRPLTIIPNGLGHEKAMEKCFKLMAPAEAIILPSGWAESKGCLMEHEKAIMDKKEVVYISLIESCRKKRT